MRSGGRVAALLVVLAGVACLAQVSPSGFDADNAWEHLRLMVGFGPRPAGSPELKLTRAYITRQLSSYGLRVDEQPFLAETPIGKIEMVNLVVRLPGRRPDRILLTGHYDTKLERTFVFLGASDGGSSAAILIELARVLKDLPHEYTYEFVWFDGEEAICEGWDECGKPDAPDNTYGSRYYVKAAREANTLASIKTMILFDMIGAKGLVLRRETDFSAPWLLDLFWSTGAKLGYKDVFVDLPGGVGGDDHLPFAQAGIPTIDLIDLADYPEWHTIADDLKAVSARSLQIVGDVTLAVLPELEKRLRNGSD